MLEMCADLEPRQAAAGQDLGRFADHGIGPETFNRPPAARDPESAALDAKAAALYAKDAARLAAVPAEPMRLAVDSTSERQGKDESE